MPTEASHLPDLSPAQRSAAMDRAAAALRDGELVVLPTETVYGVFADAGSRDALERLRSATRPDRARAFAWHAPDGEAVRSRIDLPTEVARRLAERFMPGPVGFEIEQPPARLSALRDELGVDQGVIDDGERLRVRVPAHAACARVLAQAGVPAVAAGLGAAVWAEPGAGRSVGTIPERHGAPLPSIVLDDGPTEFGRASTRVRLRLDGGFEVAPEGAIDEARVLAALERLVLFVCTGNTCRSPMAAAIAGEMLGARPFRGVTTRAASAGVAAGRGIPASDEAVRVLGDEGIDLSGHRSRPLTAELVREAEIVYTMTPSHAEAVMTLAPDAASKVFPLDPRGVIEDPVGQGEEVYRRTAARLRELIRQRLEELDA